MNKNLKIGDIVVGMGASTNSGIMRECGLSGFSAIADYTLLKTICDVADDRGTKVNVGNLFSSDLFYGGDPDFLNKWSSVGVLAVEMEAAALYMNAARAGKRALAICTISDSLITGEALPAEEREKSFTEMMELSLDLAIAQT